MAYCEDSQNHTSFPAGANNSCATCARFLCDICKYAHKETGHTIIPFARIMK